MEHLKLKFLYIFLFLLMPFTGLTQNQDELPRLKPIQTAAELKSLSEPLAVDKIIRASLVFSGVTQNKLNAYQSQFQKIVEQTIRNFKGASLTQELGDNLLQYAHNNFLSKYEEYQTKMDILLENGVFNCVSSAVFYMTLAKALNIKIGGVKTKDHAFCKVNIGGLEYDVETTTEYGFNPGEKKEFKDEFGKTTGYAYSAPGNYGDREDLGEKQMLFLILQNRISDLFIQQEYFTALELAVDGYALLEDEISHELLENSFYNYAAWLIQQNSYETGFTILDKGIQQYGKSEKLQKLRSDLVIQWTVKLMDRGDYDKAEALIKEKYKSGAINKKDNTDTLILIYQHQADRVAQQKGNKEALAIIQQGIKFIGQQPELIKSRNAYAHNYVLDLIKLEKYKEAISYLNTSRQEEIFDDKDYTDLLVYLYQEKAAFTLKREGNKEALGVIAEGIKVLGNNKHLLEQRTTYTYNYIVELINQEKFQTAVRELKAIEENGILNKNTWTELVVYSYSKEASSVEKKDGLLKAAGVLAQGITLVGQNSNLVNNYVYYIHYHVEGLFKSGQLTEAEEITQQALEIVPGNRTLKNDLLVIQNAINDS